MNDDVQRHRYLTVGRYICAAITALFACFPLIHIGLLESAIRSRVKNCAPRSRASIRDHHTPRDLRQFGLPLCSSLVISPTEGVTRKDTANRAKAQACTRLRPPQKLRRPEMRPRIPNTRFAVTPLPSAGPPSSRSAVEFQARRVHRTGVFANIEHESWRR
jgi:hypothetical protein